MRCKLTLKDIRKVRSLAEQGLSQTKIAKRFNISQGLVGYWLLSDRQRTQRNRRQYLLWETDRDKEDKKKRQQKSISRKYRIMPEFRRYCLESKRRHI